MPDAYECPLFNRDVDRDTGYRTRSVLCLPLFDRSRHPFAVLTLLNKRDAAAFDAADERAMREFAASIGVILETWNEASLARHGRASAAAGRPFAPARAATPHCP